MKVMKGFTLVELVVLTGAAAVLAAVLLPALSRAGESDKAASCMNNLRTLHQSWSMYIEDYDGWVPTHTQRMSDEQNRNRGRWWAGDIMGKYHGYDGYQQFSYVQGEAWKGTVYDCPAQGVYEGTVGESGSSSLPYGYNNLNGGLSNVNAWFCTPFLRLDMIAPDTFVIGDSTRGSALGLTSWSTYGFFGVSSVHDGGANYLNADGSVEHVMTSALYTEKHEPVEPRLTRADD